MLATNLHVAASAEAPLFCSCVINDHLHITSLLDIGARLSILHTRLAVKFKAMIKENNIWLVRANTSQMHASVLMELSITVSNCTLIHVCYVSANIAHDFIIRNYLIYDLETKVDYNEDDP